MGVPSNIKQIPLSFPKWFPESVRKECASLAAKELKKPNSVPIKTATECIDPSLLKQMELHMQKLEQYLKQNPNDIEVRSQLAKLREALKKC